MKEFPPFRLDAADQSLWRDDARVPLTPKAFAVLRYLVERAGRLVTQNELLEALWPDTFVQPEVLKSQILDIRTALGDSAREPRFIETLARRGYRFIAPVREPLGPEPAAPDREQAPLVGRDGALDELREALRRAMAGERQVVFVTGEQGIGKTTVVEAFLREAAAKGAEIARGQCLEGYGAVKEPYYPVLEALGRLSRGANGKALGAVLEAQAPTWLIQLPALLRKEHRETLQRELLGATRERMLREICDALESFTAAGALVALFEDLHWADHSTVDLISALAHRRFAAKLLLIGTYRPIDLALSQHPMKQAGHQLKSRRLAREIALAPLDETDVAAYLSRQAGGPVDRLAGWIRRQTEGNPLFMVTMIDHLRELGHVSVTAAQWEIATPLDRIEVSVPDTLRQTIELQIERLSPREQLILDAASVHGMIFSAAVTAAALEIEAEDVESACQNLARHNHIVRAASMDRLADGSFSQRYEFVHAAFRGVFYHRLAPARRAKLHRRIGDTIESLHPAGRSEAAAELAAHFEQCGDWPRAVEYLWLAAKNAWQRFAYREAVAILERALDLAGRSPEPGRALAEVRTLDTLSVLQYALHDTEGLVQTFEALAARAAERGMTAVEIRALSALAALRATDDSRDAAPLIDRLESLAERELDAATQVQTRAQCAWMRISMFGWDAPLADAHEAALVKVRETGDRVALASVLMDRSYIEWLSSRYAESLASARQSLPTLLESGRLVRYVNGRDFVATALTSIGQWGMALDILDEAIGSAERNEAPPRLAMPLVFKAWVHLNAMDCQGALEMCDRALPWLGGAFMRDREWIAMQIAASAMLGLGRTGEGIERLLDLQKIREARTVVLSWYWRIPPQLDLVDAFLANGDPDRARLEANRAIGLALATAERAWHALAYEASARVAAAQSDAVRARRDIANARNAVAGLAVPLAWRVHATAARITGEPGHLEAGRTIVLALAKSLETRPELQRKFLSAPAVAGLLGDDSTFQAAT